MRVRIHTLFIVKHLRYTYIALCKVLVLFFKAVASFCGKDGDWGQVDTPTHTTIAFRTSSIYNIPIFNHLSVNIGTIPRFITGKKLDIWDKTCVSQVHSNSNYLNAEAFCLSFVCYNFFFSFFKNFVFPFVLQIKFLVLGEKKRHSFTRKFQP